jgi:hypothetical protein
MIEFTKDNQLLIIHLSEAHLVRITQELATKNPDFQGMYEELKKSYSESFAQEVVDFLRDSQGFLV